MPFSPTSVPEPCARGGLDNRPHFPLGHRRCDTASTVRTYQGQSFESLGR
jgi:hypothetical protein